MSCRPPSTPSGSGTNGRAHNGRDWSDRVEAGSGRADRGETGIRGYSGSVRSGDDSSGLGGDCGSLGGGVWSDWSADGSDCGSACDGCTAAANVPVDTDSGQSRFILRTRSRVETVIPGPGDIDVPGIG